MVLLSMSKISTKRITLHDKHEYIMDQIAKLRIVVSDTNFSDEECHAIKASLEALLQNLDHKCGKQSRVLQKAAH
jgi:hypothetical protein